MNRSVVRALVASAAVAAAITLAGCDTDGVVPSGRASAPLSERMVAEIESKNMEKTSPILGRIFKEEAEMEVWKQTRDGSFALLKTYPICRWSGDLGPKKKQGDRQAPEGFYTITPGQMNPQSNYYLAFNTGFPNAYDRAWGYTGSDLMVHGDCSSRGCYAMTDEQIQEIYSLARESFFGGQKAFQLQAFPFRMTALNMAKHRSNPNFAFWKMIKEGYDNFEATRQQPKVAVCDKRYVFDAVAPDNASRPLAFNPSGKCPAYELDRNIASAVLEHRRQEQVQMTQYIARDVAVMPPRTGIDGGMHPTFAAKLGTRNSYDSNGRTYQVDTNGRTFEVASGETAPGALPRIAAKPATPAATPAYPAATPAYATATPATPAATPAYQTATTSAPVAMASVRLPQPAPRPKEGEAPPERPTTIAGLLGRMFSGSKSEPKPTAPATVVATAGNEPGDLRSTHTEMAAKPKQPPTAVRAAWAPAPLGSAAKPRETAPVKPTAVADSAPASAPRPPEFAWPPKAIAEPKPVAEPKPAAAPKAVAETPVPVANSAPNAAPKPRVVKQADATPPAPEMRTAFAAPSGRLLAGAAPVVPVGSFSGR